MIGSTIISWVEVPIGLRFRNSRKYNLRTGTKLPDHLDQILGRQRNATLRRSISLARDMQKYGTTTAAHTRSLIVVQNDHEVVEVIVPPKALCTGGVGQPDLSIIVPVMRCIAPSRQRRDPGYRKSGLGSAEPICSIEYV